MARVCLTLFDDTCPNKCSNSKVYGANMGPTWVRQGPGRPHVGPMSLAIWVATCVLSVLMTKVIQGMSYTHKCQYDPWPLSVCPIRGMEASDRNITPTTITCPECWQAHHKWTPLVNVSWWLSCSKPFNQQRSSKSNIWITNNIDGFVSDLIMHQFLWFLCWI